MTDLLVRGASLPVWSHSEMHVRRGSPIDLRLTEGRVACTSGELPLNPHEEVFDASGWVVVPGLHDHHIHLRSLVAARRSVSVGPTDVSRIEDLARILRRSPVDRQGWRRAIGYHESVAGDLDRWSLDGLAPGSPLRVQHRSGAMWVLNSPAIDTLELASFDHPGIERDCQGQPTGRLVRMDSWLADQLGADDPVAQIATVSHALAELGVTGVTEATPDATWNDLMPLVEAVQDGRLSQRLHAMCPTGVELPEHPLVTRGPHKLVLDDDSLPSFADLVGLVATAHDADVPVAVHCVTRTQLVLTVAAFDAAGTRFGDRIEHGSVVPPELVDALARLGVTVITNPSFVYSRGDEYLDEVDDRDVPFLYPCASLLVGGVKVAGGSDAPFGTADPWAAATAAHQRRTRRGRPIGPAEAVPLSKAVGLFTGWASAPARQRLLAVGEPADLCFLEEGKIPGYERLNPVAATIVAGKVVHCIDRSQ